MLKNIHIKFKSKVKLFKKENYQLEISDLKSIYVLVFLEKKEIGSIELDFKKIIQGSPIFDKSTLDLDYWYSFAEFQFSGIIEHDVPKELISSIEESLLLIKYKALRINAFNSNSKTDFDKTFGLLLNENGSAVKINISMN
jgi:hypothetical protein